MRAVLFATIVTLAVAIPADGGGASNAAVCSPESYLPYVAVAQWSATSPVELLVLPLTRPLGPPHLVDLPGDTTGPASLRCSSGSIVLWTADGVYRVGEVASQRPVVQVTEESTPTPEENGMVLLSCSPPETTGPGLSAPAGRQRQLPSDLGRRYQDYGFFFHRVKATDATPARLRLGVHEDQRRGTPRGSFASSQVKREAIVMDLTCPSAGPVEP